MPRDRTVLFRHFSPDTKLLYLLVQERDDLPNLEISGIKMKSSSPSIQAVLDASLRTLQPLAGVCLDTCGGLGYSAIAMARAGGVEKVVCFEVDENVVQLAQHNPASRELFSNPKVELRVEDVFEGIDGFGDQAFDRVFHDPPRLGLAGELYSEAFYRKLFRVLKPGGKLFHYTGDPGEKRGKRVRAGVIRRLQVAGFDAARDVPEAQGVSAVRPWRRGR